ncbi:MAG TPA: hypothetical protein VGR35_16835, partial [Tepidisphaeraceae bacterium]|nr:hypothetical protein [Tepidisphaeraceae bacterium]
MPLRRVVVVVLVGFTLSFGSRVAPAVAAEQDPGVSLRVRFGMKDKEGTDWSGKLTTSAGTVQSFRGWRWMPGDNAEGDSWTIATRRLPAQSAADRQRVARGGQMPIGDNGFIVTLNGTKPQSEITFDAKPGTTRFKLSDVPYGQPLVALDGNLQIERVPAAAELADTHADEDYPAVARGKDGTLYVAYVAFTHGKDFYGPRERPTTPESGPVVGPNATGPVRRIEKPQDLDYLAQPAGGDEIFLRVRRPDGNWGDPIAVTDGKHELYRPAVATDGSGRVWVFYSAHLDADENLDHGNWELMARSFSADGQDGGEVVNVSRARGTDFMPAATTDSSGKVCVTWVGGRERNFNVFVATQTDSSAFGAAQRVSSAPGNEWEPAVAADANGNVAVAWDTYAKGDYDVYLARRGGDGKFAQPQPVAATLAFEVRPSLAYDAQGKLWIAWEESGDHWGKDFGALKKEGIPLYLTGRSLAMKVLGEDGQQWHSAPDVMEAMPERSGPQRRARAAAATGPAGARGAIAPCFPRLATDPAGNVWLAFRGKPGMNWRVPVGSVWFEYVTRLEGDAWTDAVYVPRSNNILDNRPAVIGETVAGSGGRLTLVYSGDGRAERNAPKLGDPHLRGVAEG